METLLDDWKWSRKVGNGTKIVGGYKISDPGFLNFICAMEKKSLDPIVYEATIATNDAEKQDPQCLKIAKKYLIWIFSELF